MINKTESAARKFLKQQAGERVFWIEQASGGTVGVPDAMVIVGDRLIPFELKAGKVDLKENVFEWKVTIRPSQKRVGWAMWGFGIKVWILVVDTKGKGHFLCSMAEALQSIKQKRKARMERVDNGFLYTSHF